MQFIDFSVDSKARAHRFDMKLKLLFMVEFYSDQVLFVNKEIVNYL